MTPIRKQLMGPYELLAPIGAGGMGEVFRARDTRLNRSVAVKVLPNDFTADAERLRRFEQEAKTLAALNHPNVLTIFDTGVQEGAPYLVSELLEGKTLRDELSGGPLALRKATEYALQIAQGLAAAHSKGIIHRDLKPENIFITKDGRVKILDFGLAKLQENPHSGFRTPNSSDPDTPTLADSTQPGMVLGTPAYMSPEQVRGEPADQRSDIFAFGCVMYEMLSGTRAFRRDTPVQSMNAILSEDPPNMSAGQAGLPRLLEKVVRRCLEKLADNRFQSAKDLAFAIESASTTTAPTFASKASAWKWAAFVAAGLALALAIWLARRPNATPQPIVATWLELTPPAQGFDTHPAPAISPDGRQVAFWAPTPNDTNNLGLWIRSLDSPGTRLLPGTASSSSSAGDIPAAWSPDGRSLAFFADGKLKRMDLNGGSALNLAEAANPRGCSWGSSGVILFAPAGSTPLYQISASGGNPTLVPLSPILDVYPVWPHFLPDGQHFLITCETNGFLFLGSLKSKETRPLSNTRLGSRGEYAAGYLFFGRSGSLFAQPFDTESLATKGEPVPIADNLGFSYGDYWDYAFSVSPAGSLVYWTGPYTSVSQLTWFNRKGERLGTVGNPGEYVGFTVSPTAQQLVVERHDVGPNEVRLWLLDSASGTESLFSSVSCASTPVWSRFDDRVYFGTFPGLAAQSVQTSAEQKLYDESCWLSDVSPDGKYALVTQDSSETGNDVWLFFIKGDKERKPYLTSRYNEWGGRFSPDGRWVAYVDDQSGRSEVRVQSFPAPGRPVPVSHKGGQWPEWRRDGKELYFFSLDGQLMAAKVEATESTFNVSEPKPLFPVNVGGDAFRQQCYASEDGERFLVNARVEGPVPGKMNVVLNWKALLKRK